jgi:phosphoribosylformylglycinamidine synthase
VTNCLNFGSPADPAVMWQFGESVRGLADACLSLGVPVTGGNVSFYNQTGPAAIQPTPVVGVLGVLADVRSRMPSGFVAAGETIMLLGHTAAEFGGSLWAHVTHGHLGGRPPVVDLAAERRLGDLLAATAAAGIVSSAHDLSEGGLALALAECCLIGGGGGGPVGCVVEAADDAFAGLFSESAARAIVTVRPGAGEQFADLCATHATAARAIGTTGGQALAVSGLFSIPLVELGAAYRGTLPALFG